MPARTSQNHPKLWRKSRGGKDYGNFYVTLLGKDVNLGTQNAEIAGRRRAEAAKGRRGAWASDAEEIARDMEPTTEQLASAGPPPSSQPLPPPPPITVPIAAPPPAPSSPPVAAAPPAAPDTPAPLQLPPMSEENQRAEADATNAAAAGTGAATDGGADPGAPAAEPDAVFSPGQLDQLLREVASAIVIGQIELQGYLIKRRTGKIPPNIAPGSKLHELAEGAWVAQFNLWFPKVDDLPPVALAIGLPMLFMLKQAKEAVDPPPKNGHTPAPAPSPASVVQPPETGVPPIVVS